MPIEIKDLDGGIGGLIVGRGVLKGREFVDALVKFLTQDEDKFKEYRYCLTDFTAVTEVEVPSEDIRLVARHSIKAAVSNRDANVAIVADRDITYGLSRMWEIAANETKWEIMVFKSRVEAKNWIRERVKKRFDIDHLKLA